METAGMGAAIPQAIQQQGGIQGHPQGHHQGGLQQGHAIQQHQPFQYVTHNNLKVSRLFVYKKPI